MFLAQIPSLYLPTNTGRSLSYRDTRFCFVVYGHWSGDVLSCNVKPSLGGGNPPPG